MAKKKLLNEAQVRRFMGLAGLRPLSENAYTEEVNENIYEEEEDELPAEEPEMGMGDEEVEEPEMAAAEPEAVEPEAGEEEVSVTKDAIDNAGNAMMDLLGQLGYEGGEDAEPAMDDMPADEPEMDDMPADEPEMELGDEEAEEEEEVMEALSGVNLELSEDELVQEVAKRVAKRILKAKRAQKQLDEALGNKKRQVRRK